MKVLIFVVFVFVFSVCAAQNANVPGSGAIPAGAPTTSAPNQDATSVKQFFDAKCEEQLQKQVTKEFQASLVYLSMSTYCARWDVALPGFSKKFRAMSDEERDHGLQLLQYINLRGGVAKVPWNVNVTTYMEQFNQNDWGGILNVLKAALKLERTINANLVNHVRSCVDTKNYHMEDFIDGKFLTEQVDSIHELGRMLTQVKMIAGDLVIPNYGLYEYDRKLLK